VQSFKLDWNAATKAFVLSGGRTLNQLMSDVISQQLGARVKLD
jgi:hypothetical protein